MRMRITVDGTAYEVDVEVLEADASGSHGAIQHAPVHHASFGAAPAPAASSAARPAPSRSPAPAAGTPGSVTSPIAGTVLKVQVKVGDTVGVDQPVLVLEAMKMESEVASPVAGTVTEVCVSPGQAVASGQVLIRLN